MNRVKDYSIILNRDDDDPRYNTKWSAHYYELGLGCAGLGKDPNEAVNDLEQNIKVYIEQTEEMGRELPDPQDIYE